MVREALRIHPAAAMTLERTVPECGLALPDWSVMPGGTTVGMNPYVFNRNKEIFGPDADEFIPDRWFQQEGKADIEYQERMRLWNASDLTFGGSSRIFIGRHLSQLELYKVVATLITRYEIEFVNAKEEWNAVSRWLYRVSGGLTCRLRKRDNRGRSVGTSFFSFCFSLLDARSWVARDVSFDPDSFSRIHLVAKIVPLQCSVGSCGRRLGKLVLTLVAGVPQNLASIEALKDGKRAESLLCATTKKFFFGMKNGKVTFLSCLSSIEQPTASGVVFSFVPLPHITPFYELT